MSLVMQAKLLRVLQEGEVTPVGQLDAAARWTCAILAATSKNLLEEIEQGRFRDDLYDRLNVVNIAPAAAARAPRGRAAAGRALPAARERRERLQAQAADPARGRVPLAAALAGQRARAAQPDGAPGGDRRRATSSPTAT